ncbi:complement factor H-like isoform X1 [Gambusia affinis]|uniref:complement factor H-like isoform X1 n=1 Tax=Gambusia affinis TaxID=33528 RepID=UPI001CDCD96A|nr:complement factor H-like isoform X1 [Gambusia affinis]XP_043991290.1 complement factor H-like isoform X1 [Gambusia affinis]
MEVRCLEFVLLLWVPGLLQAQGPQPCSAPSLDAGFFLPVQESYPHGTKISYSCNDGYKAERGGWWGTSTCFDGIWFGTPACIENPPTCREPPKISNATIINLDFQDVFTQNTEVVYQCKDGHTTKEGATKKSVFCRAGVWTDVPTCAPSTGPGHPTVTSIDNCGAFPQVPNGLAEPHERLHLKYTCQDYYKLVGPDTVVCHRGGTWSEVPTCKVDFCRLNTAEYPDLLDTTYPFIRNGDTESRRCVDKWTFTTYALVRCIEMKLSVSRCCNMFQIRQDQC